MGSGKAHGARPWGRFRFGSEANTSLLGMLLATMVFAGSVLTIIDTSLQDREEAQETREANQEVVAATLAELLLFSPGQRWYTRSDPCTNGALDDDAFDPDGLVRLGLGEEWCAITNGQTGGAGNLSYTKFLNLYEARMDADPDNGLVDYEEARESLALAAAMYNIHIRSFPLLPEVSQLLAQGWKDPNLRPLYIGDFDELHGNQAPNYWVQHAAGAADGASAATLYVSVTNNGTTTTAFSVTFKVQTKKEMVAELHTGPLAPGQTQNVTLALNKSSDWQWAPNKNGFEYVIRDPSKTVASGSVSMTGLSMGAASAKKTLAGESAQLEWTHDGSSAEVNIDYCAFDGGGKAATFNGWSIEIRDATDTLVASNGALGTKCGTQSVTLTTTGVHSVKLIGNSGWTMKDYFYVAPPSLETFTPNSEPSEWVPGPAVVPEATFVDSLVNYFDLAVPDADYAAADVPFNASGDVFPDDNRFLAEWLPDVLYDGAGAGTLANYNLLVICSNVDHNSLTSGSIKYPIRDWVLAGGTMIVCGSDDQAVQWLEPIFHAGLESAGGGISVPDQTHPILHTPNDLDVDTYDNHGTAWEFNNADDEGLFTHVVLQGDDDLLAVSDPGTFGLGRVILTSWQPYDLLMGDPAPECTAAALDASCPALQLINNFMTVAYRGLYLDYGPAVPSSGNQGVDCRIGTLWHPQLGRMVELYFCVYVF